MNDARAAPASRVHWYWRMIAWLVAVPLGFVITAWPAYELHLIRRTTSSTSSWARAPAATRLAIGTLVWALVTALLVQLFIEGGRVWSDRRRHRREFAAVRSPRRARSASAPG